MNNYNISENALPLLMPSEGVVAVCSLGTTFMFLRLNTQSVGCMAAIPTVIAAVFAKTR